MDPLATETDITDGLGRDLTTSEEARINSLLADASARVRDYTGQQFTRSTTTDKLRVRRGKVKLSQRPVNDEPTIVDLDSNVVNATWDGFDTLDIAGRESLAWFELNARTTPLVAVMVTYDHGYDEIPAQVVAVVRSMVMRALGVNPAQTGLQSETIEGYAYQMGAAAAAGGLGLLPDERSVLDRFRRPLNYADGGRL